MKISVLGCGRWGSFLAWYLDSIRHQIVLWGRAHSQNYQKVQQDSAFDNITLTQDLHEALSHADVLVVSISAQALRSFMRQLSAFDLRDKVFVLCMKGLEDDTGLRLSEIVAAYAPDASVAVWVGPGHVQDYRRGVPNCMLIDSEEHDVKKFLVDAFSGGLIRFYYGNDLLGSEVGAASKNVIGIAAGMLDGYGYTSLKGALMARGAREISVLIKQMGGNELSAYGLCHIGDYEATLFSPYSHNRQFGELYIKGQKLDKLAEGVTTTKALMVLSDRYGVELPITKAIYSIVYENQKPKEVLSKLFLRKQKHEF
ncbi:MAG: NAD(P)H-dependent glycerol-3-phosphate dehydrogenase [Christensenellales bacterium]|jgi:glycerol-3-phosphate dehydrogenase (NAD(P)+)